MHSSVYSYLNIGSTNVFTTINGGCYALNAGPIRRILGVFDYTNNRILYPIDRASPPIAQAEKQEVSPGKDSSAPQQVGSPAIVPISLQGTQAGYYRHYPPNSQGLAAPNGVICFIPIPQQVRLISMSFEFQVPTIINPSDTLTIPEDGRDMVVAGVNYLANLYLKRMDEAQIWAGIYSALKKGESLV